MTLLAGPFLLTWTYSTYVMEVGSGGGGSCRAGRTAAEHHVDRSPIKAMTMEMSMLAALIDSLLEENAVVIDGIGPASSLRASDQRMGVGEMEAR